MRVAIGSSSEVLAAELGRELCGYDDKPRDPCPLPVDGDGYDS